MVSLFCSIYIILATYLLFYSIYIVLATYLLFYCFCFYSLLSFMDYLLHNHFPNYGIIVISELWFALCHLDFRLDLLNSFALLVVQHYRHHFRLLSASVSVFPNDQGLTGFDSKEALSQNEYAFEVNRRR